MRFYMRKCFGMRKEGLENSTHPGHIEDKRDKGNQRVNYLTSLCKWILEYGSGRDSKSKKKTVFINTKYRNLWRARIVRAPKRIQSNIF